MANELHTLQIGSTSYSIRPLSVETYTAKNGSDKPSTYPAGFSTNMVYSGTSTGWPYDYGNALTIKGTGTTQLMMSWNASQTSSNSEVAQSIYLRSQRDSAGDNWSKWTTIMTDDIAYTKTQVNNALSTKADKNGSNATGTWGINISGKANTAGTADLATTAGSSPIWSNVGSEILKSDFNSLGNYHGYFNKNAQSGISNNPVTAGHIVSFSSASCPFQIATSYKSSEGIYYRKNNTSGTTGWSAWNEIHSGSTLNLGENCYIKRYASPHNDGGVDSLNLHGHYSVDVDSDFFVDSPYITRIRGGNEDNGGIGDLTLSVASATLGHQIPSQDLVGYINAMGSEVTIMADDGSEHSQILVTQQKIKLTGGDAGLANTASITLANDKSIALGGTLCTVPSGMTFRPAASSGTYLGTSSYYWNYGYITNGYITTVRSTTAYSTNGFYESSDERLKNFGDRIPVDLDKISRLKKHYFEWKNEKESGIQIGVSAQEIKELYPELVKENEDGYLNVAYDKLSVVALAAVDELHKKNKELEDRIAKLEAIVNKLIDNE